MTDKTESRIGQKCWTTMHCIEEGVVEQERLGFGATAEDPYKSFTVRNTHGVTQVFTDAFVAFDLPSLVEMCERNANYWQFKLKNAREALDANLED